MISSDELKKQFDTQWGGFRKWLSANPLTGFWSGIGGGFALGAVTVARLIG